MEQAAATDRSGLVRRTCWYNASIVGMIFASIAMMLWIQSDRAKI